MMTLTLLRAAPGPASISGGPEVPRRRTAGRVLASNERAEAPGPGRSLEDRSMRRCTRSNRSISRLQLAGRRRSWVSESSLDTALRVANHDREWDRRSSSQAGSGRVRSRGPSRAVPGAVVRGRPRARLMSWWWLVPSVSAIPPPKPEGSPLGRRLRASRSTISSGSRRSYLRSATALTFAKLPPPRRKAPARAGLDSSS